jgi:hypothetical protein
MAPTEARTFKSIEEIRSNLYPTGAGLLEFEGDEAVEFPRSLTTQVTVVAAAPAPEQSSAAAAPKTRRRKAR